MNKTMFVLLLAAAIMLVACVPSPEVDDVSVAEEEINAQLGEPKAIAGQAVKTKVFLSRCEDTDGGLNYGTAGTVRVTASDKVLTFSDTCTRRGLKEYYCKGTSMAVSEKPCEGGLVCKNGACVSPSSSPSRSCTPEEVRGAPPRCEGNQAQYQYRKEDCTVEWRTRTQCQYGCSGQGVCCNLVPNNQICSEDGQLILTVTNACGYAMTTSCPRGQHCAPNPSNMSGNLKSCVPGCWEGFVSGTESCSGNSVEKQYSKRDCTTEVRRLKSCYNSTDLGCDPITKSCCRVTGTDRCSADSSRVVTPTSCGDFVRRDCDVEMGGLCQVVSGSPTCTG